MGKLCPICKRPLSEGIHLVETRKGYAIIARDLESKRLLESFLETLEKLGDSPSRVLKDSMHLLVKYLEEGLPYEEAVRRIAKEYFQGRSP